MLSVCGKTWVQEVKLWRFTLYAPCLLLCTKYSTFVFIFQYSPYFERKFHSVAPSKKLHSQMQLFVSFMARVSYSLEWRILCCHVYTAEGVIEKGGASYVLELLWKIGNELKKKKNIKWCVLNKLRNMYIARL